MKQFFITIAGVFAGLMLFLVAIPILLVTLAMGSVKKTEPVAPDTIVLALDLRLPMTDQQPRDFVSRLNGAQSVVGVVETLMRAERDPDVKGIYIRGAEGGIMPAAAEEIRAALLAFQKKGKFIITHSQGIMSPVAYTAVSASDEIWLQASSDIIAPGLSVEYPFMRGLLDRFDVKPDLIAMHEYKTAANQYLYKDYTAAHKEATLGLINGLYTSNLDMLATDLEIAPTDLRGMLESGPLSAQQALSGGLVDKLGYDADAEQSALARAGDDAELISLAAYSNQKSLSKKSSAIALIEGEGAILTGSSETMPEFQNDPEMLGDDVSMAIREATENDNIKAIVFRVNSPGGSPVASDQIWAAVKDAQDSGKPVIVSMGSYAASGGYYVSAGADAIVANKGTITGSIGVVGGKLSINQALQNYGVNFSSLHVGGDFANAYGTDAFTPVQKEQVRAMFERTYDDFTTKVAEGRNLPLSQVRDIAKGRVYTGEQAKDLGLVDALGGLRVALETAKRLAKIPADQHISIRRFPDEVSPLEELKNLLNSNLSLQMKLGSMTRIFDQPAVQLLNDQARISSQHPVRMEDQKLHIQ